MERSPEIEHKINNRRANWNEYMRNYRRSQKERIDKAMKNPEVMINFNDSLQFLDSRMIQNLLLRYNNILVELYNMRPELFAEEITDALNDNIHNFKEFSKIILYSFEELIKQSPLSAASLTNN